MAQKHWSSNWVWKILQQFLDRRIVHQTGISHFLHHTCNLSKLLILKLKEKIIPEFERLHGPQYQALIVVDNSQGHGIYAPDALLICDMKFNTAGPQPRLQDGWFINGLGEMVVQSMIFPTDHPTFPGKPKGMKQILTKWRLLWAKLKMQCKKPDCDPNGTDCCAKCVIDLLLDFKEQKSFMHKTIEATVHLYIMLPKYHCEPNFIEFFCEWWRNTSESIVIILIQASRKHSKCHGFCFGAYHLEMGGLDDMVSGCP